MALFLETNRLLLRTFQDSDLEAFLAYRSDPAVARYQGWEAPYSRAAAVAFVQEMKEKTPATPGEWYQLAIELKASGEMIGDCAFHTLEDAQQADIAFTLARQYQGQGYATEAVKRMLDYIFAELGLHRVRAIADVKNLASVKLLERIGMRREGHFVENIWFKGEWGGEYYYGLLKREWEQLKMDGMGCA
ncbi:MAG: GNAT family N-acetyltransferase [Chloroflexi bacterium]|nr:GNAT family N-acetyltransferase [Chloroflexota bacterium]